MSDQQHNPQKDATPNDKYSDNNQAQTPPQSHEEKTRRSPALIATAIALPLMVIAGFVTAVVMANRNPSLGPVTISAVPQTQANSKACGDLLTALPEDLGDWKHAEIKDPIPPGTAAWQTAKVDTPVILRCGIDQPLEFTQTSQVVENNGVQWFVLKDPPSVHSDGKEEDSGQTTWFAVDREVIVAVTIPKNDSADPIQNIGPAVTKTLQQQPIHPTSVQ